MSIGYPEEEQNDIASAIDASKLACICVHSRLKLTPQSHPQPKQNSRSTVARLHRVNDRLHGVKVVS